MNKVEEKNIKEKMSLGTRMKNYENVTRHYLMSKQPSIVRIDGKAFHTYCKQKWIKGPFDENIIKAFHQSTLKVCENIQNVEFAYHQSDEVSFFLKDYNTKEQQQYFGGNIQKLASTITSEFTYWFNKYIVYNVAKSSLTPNSMLIDYNNLQPALFDCRVFNIPVHEVSNYFIWRQRDCIKNSITSYALSEFSHKELLNKKSDVKLEMLKNIGKDFNLLPIHFQRGSSFYKVDIEKQVKDLDKEIIEIYFKKEKEIPETIIRSEWLVNLNSPIFSQERNFIEIYTN